MNQLQSQLLQQALSIMSDPKALAAVQSATAPLLEKLQGKDSPLNALFEAMNLQQQAPAEQPTPATSAVPDLKSRIGSLFIHSESGNMYILFGISNETAEDQVKFPATAIYLAAESREMYSRPLVDFVNKFQPL